MCTLRVPLPLKRKPITKRSATPKPLLVRLINGLLGVAWGVAFLGAVLGFKLLAAFGTLTALIAAVMGAIPGLVGVLWLEYLLFSVEATRRQLEHLQTIESLLLKRESENA